MPVHFPFHACAVKELMGLHGDIALVTTTRLWVTRKDITPQKHNPPYSWAAEETQTLSLLQTDSTGHLSCSSLI